MSSPSCRGEQPARWASGPVLAIALVVGLAYALAVLLGTYPGTTHFDTAEIHMWSRLGFVLNTGRHPPLLPWLVHAVDLLVPLGHLGLLGLAFVNMLLGAYAVWRIARLVVGVERAALALALYGLLPYGTWLALKLNHNAILMSLWPLTVWAFLACLRRPTFARGALLGVAAAAGVLAKYYTVLLLAAMLLATLWRSGRGQFYRTPAPWIALGVLGALVAPHLYVSYLADSAAFATLFQDAGYQRPNPLMHALQPAMDGEVSLVRMLRANMLALSPMLAGFGGLLWWQRTSDGAGPAVVRDRGDGSFDVVCLLVAIPLVLTVGIAAALGLPASANWTSPVFTLLPVVLAGLLVPPSRRMRTVVLRCAGAACIALPLSGPIVLYFNFKGGSRAVVAPNAEIAREAAAVWSAASGKRAEILMGQHRHPGIAVASDLLAGVRSQGKPDQRGDDRARGNSRIVHQCRENLQRASDGSAGGLGRVCLSLAEHPDVVGATRTRARYPRLSPVAQKPTLHAEGCRARLPRRRRLAVKRMGTHTFWAREPTDQRASAEGAPKKVCPQWWGNPIRNAAIPITVLRS